MVRNTVTLKKTDGTPDTGKAVEAYQYQSTPPYYSGKLADLTEVPNIGQYYADFSISMLVTILVNSVVQVALTGIQFLGDDGLTGDNTITTSKIADLAITNQKIAVGTIDPDRTTFALDF